MRRFLALCIYFAVASCGFAQTITYSTFNYASTELFDPVQSLTVSGTTSTPGYQAYAFQFEAQTTGLLRKLRGVFSQVGGSTSNGLRLSPDVAGEIGTPYLSGQFGVTSTGPQIYEIIIDPLPGIPTLHAGQKYWLTFWAPFTSVKKAYMAQSVVPHLRMGVSTTPDEFTYLDDQLPAAFEVYVTPVPEPATASILALGLIPLLKRKSKER